jgi:hypothetical protein
MKQEKKINKIAFKWFPLNITEITFRKTTKEKKIDLFIKNKKNYRHNKKFQFIHYLTVHYQMMIDDQFHRPFKKNQENFFFL